MEKICIEQDCGRSNFCRGYCSRHYQLRRKAGEFGHPPCAVEGCSSAGVDSGMCNAHYKAKRVSGGLFSVDDCSFPECQKPSVVKGWCKGHYKQIMKGYGPVPLRGEPKPTTKWFVNAQGYRERRVRGENGKYLGKPELEHREIMAEQIGRPLARTEEVHHKNGDRADNRLENLQLWSTKQPKGQHWRDKLEYAREILALYEPLEKSGFHDGESGDRE